MSSDAYFDFITDKRQWDVVIDIHNHLPSVKQKLLNDFWMRVTENLESIFSDRKCFVERSDDLFDKNSVLAVRHEDWSDVFKVGFGQLAGHVWVGVYCNDIREDSYNILADQLRVKLQNSRRDSTAWPSWYHLGEDFTNVSSFKRILPSCQESAAADYAKRLQEIVVKSEPILTQYLATWGCP
ncbi:hypothetical protein [Geomonas subterranea]|uniref:hypothetical protein n=1 Tax=Geomonas subterranea TaxID=2847989 RepID=UPI001CD3C8F3|nr:hypothetical protein [Geomonas fuzhouensis]